MTLATVHILEPSEMVRFLMHVANPLLQLVHPHNTVSVPTVFVV